MTDALSLSIVCSIALNGFYTSEIGADEVDENNVIEFRVDDSGIGQLYRFEGPPASSMYVVDGSRRSHEWIIRRPEDYRRPYRVLRLILGNDGNDFSATYGDMIDQIVGQYNFREVGAGYCNAVNGPSFGEEATQ